MDLLFGGGDDSEYEEVTDGEEGWGSEESEFTTEDDGWGSEESEFTTEDNEFTTEDNEWVTEEGSSLDSQFEDFDWDSSEQSEEDNAEGLDFTEEDLFMSLDDEIDKYKDELSFTDIKELVEEVLTSEGLTDDGNPVEDDILTKLENNTYIPEISVSGDLSGTTYKYILVDGFKRLAAMQNLGYLEVLAIVIEPSDYPGINFKLMEMLSNWKIPYDYLDKERCLQVLNYYNDTITNNEKELLLGLGKGELPKFIDLLNSELREEFITKNMTIDSAFKKLEKKRKKETEEEQAKVLGEKNLENKQELGLIDGEIRDGFSKFEPEQQKPGERHPLPPELAKAVEVRDNYTCQGCGISGLTYSNIFEKHHILPVYFGGKDELDNLILLCPTCHKLVHRYSVGAAIIDAKDKPLLENVVKLGDVIRAEIEKSDKPLEYFRKIFAR